MTSFCFEQLCFRHLTPGNGKKSDKTAVEGSDKSLSWYELEHTCQQLKADLYGMTDNAHLPVIIIARQQANSIAYMLSALMSGICFVPVDADIPASRLEAIKEQMGAGVMLDLETNTSSHFGQQLRIPESELKQTAYIMFTSGSTGQPKGVMISYRALAAFARWSVDATPVNQNMVFCNHALLSFDLSLLSIIPALNQGASLVLFSPSMHLDSKGFIQRLSNNACTTWISTPSLLHICCLNKAFCGTRLPALKYFNLCGEVLAPELIHKIKQRFPNAVIYNSYGPTEATVAITSIEITDSILTSYPKRLPVGPVTSVCRVEPDESRLAKENTHSQGELILSGPQLMTGYLSDICAGNVPNLTHYASGDLASEQDGLIFIHDRLDSMIKLNGHRIELKEIDAVVLQNLSVEFCKTIAIERQGKTVRLVCCIKSDTDQIIDSHQLKKRIAEFLPGYMVPSEFIELVSIPTNERHKVDISELRELYGSIDKTGDAL